MKRYVVATASAFALAAALVVATPAYAQGPPPAQVSRLCALAADVIDRIDGIVPNAVLQWALQYYNAYCL